MLFTLCYFCFGLKAVDQDKSGSISADELQRALLNGNWSQFNGETCRLMIGMFDKDRYSVDYFKNTLKFFLRGMQCCYQCCRYMYIIQGEQIAISRNLGIAYNL